MGSRVLTLLGEMVPVVSAIIKYRFRINRSEEISYRLSLKAAAEDGYHRRYHREGAKDAKKTILLYVLSPLR